VRDRLLPLVLALLLAGSVGCATALERVDEVRSDGQELAETARFCLAIARAASAYEAGDPATAADAAEELLVQAPPELREDARGVVEALRRAQDGEPEVLDDPELRAQLERLRTSTRERCDPTS
jgi:hypothetical protein